MCYVCCKEFKGWCKSFTRIEAFLSVLEALLLCVLIGLVTFLTIHFIVCATEQDRSNQQIPPITVATTTSPQSKPADSVAEFPSYVSEPTVRTTSVSTTTLSPDIECTWTPSKKTEAPTHYYWTPDRKHVTHQQIMIHSTSNVLNNDDGPNYDRHSDEYDASQRYKNYVAALVKLKPPEDVTFGCILTKLTQYWTLTAASCIEAIEEVESLDSFFIMDSYGTMKEGWSHAVMDVQIHPLYQGVNRSYDLAALRSENVLISSSQLLVKLPTMLEYFIVAVGERFTILGYGAYRSLNKSPTGRQLREVSTYTVSLAQCSSEEGKDMWSLRHLLRGEALTAGSCGATGGGACGAYAMCAGSMLSRAAPCFYCSGTPLLRGGKLYGIMAANRQCGVACEPTLYVNVAALKDWVHTVISS